MTLAAATAEYLDGHLRAERNASPHTLRNYGVDLRQFAAFAGPDSDLSAFTPARIRDFLAALYAQGCGKTTVARHLSSVRSLFAYCADRGYIPSNPARLLASPKLGRKLPQFPTTEQVNRMLDEPMPASAAFPERDHALLEVLYGCGVRVSELTGLDLGDVDFSEMTLRVTGKGRKQRLVPFGGKAKDALESYLAARAKLAGVARKERALFLNLRGKRLTPRSVARMVKASALAFGLPLDLHPHALRHAFASHLLGEGADLRAIQEMLGHRSLATTQRYTHTDIRKLMEVYDAAHPLERGARKPE